jgi:hypothetical protein
VISLHRYNQNDPSAAKLIEVIKTEANHTNVSEIDGCAYTAQGTRLAVWCPALAQFRYQILVVKEWLLCWGYNHKSGAHGKDDRDNIRKQTLQLLFNETFRLVVCNNAGSWATILLTDSSWGVYLSQVCTLQNLIHISKIHSTVLDRGIYLIVNFIFTFAQVINNLHM